MIDTLSLVADARALYHRPEDGRELERTRLAATNADRIHDHERRCLAIYRIVRLGPEEITYWSSWAFRQDATRNEWAQVGMAILFGGDCLPAEVEVAS